MNLSNDAKSCGRKKPFRSRAEAKRFLRNNRDATREGQAEYHCGFCSMWHLGHIERSNPMIKKINQYVEYLVFRKTEPRLITGLVIKKFGIMNVSEYRKNPNKKYKLSQ